LKIVLLIILFSIFNVFAQTNVSKYEDKETKEETEAKTRAKSVFDIDFDKVDRSRESIIQQPQMLEQAFDKEIDSTKYILGPGDQLLIKIWGIVDEQFLSEITPEGYLIIPSISEVMISGKALSDASQIIKNELKKSFKNSHFSVRLIRMRKFRVYVVGEIKTPGTYYLRASDRVVDAIQIAGGTLTWGDETRIQVRHLDDTADTLNTSRFFQEGSLEENIFVSSGDVIFIPRIDLTKPYVIIEGNVGSQGVYQILPNETLLDFLARVGALSRNSNIENLVLIRDDKKYLYNLLENKREVTQEVLKLNDRIIIPTNRDQVYVKGEVFKPGPFPYLANYTTRDYAGFAGILESAKNLNDIYIIHKDTGKIEKGSDVVVHRGDVVVVPRNARESLKDILAILTPIISIGLSSYAIIRSTR
jgi:protein involved in polysaccharide export with SLBB domain